MSIYEELDGKVDLSGKRATNDFLLCRASYFYLGHFGCVGWYIFSE